MRFTAEPAALATIGDEILFQRSWKPIQAPKPDSTPVTVSIQEHQHQVQSTNHPQSNPIHPQFQSTIISNQVQSTSQVQSTKNDQKLSPKNKYEPWWKNKLGYSIWNEGPNRWSESKPWKLTCFKDYKVIVIGDSLGI